MSYVELASSCDDGDCPKIMRHDETGQIGVRGRVGHSPDDPETDIWMTGAEWTTLLAQLAR